MKKPVALVVMSLCGIAFADDVTWTGNGETPAWSDAGNWSKAPAEGDRALFPADAIVTAVADDMTTFGLFSSIDIPESSTLFFSDVTTTVKVPFTGKGRVLTNGGNLTFAVDNTAFEGFFAMTNTYLRLTNEGGSVNPLGTTNVVWFYYPDSSSYAIMNGASAGKGIPAVSNEFHLVGNQFKNLIINNLVTGLNFYGPVYLVGTGQWPTAAGTAYGYNFHGGVFGGGFKPTGQSAGYYMIRLHDGLVSNVTCNCFAGGYYIDTKVQDSTLMAGRGGYGFQFGPKAETTTNVTFQFGGSYEDGGYFDLNGDDLQGGDIYFSVSKKMSTWAGAYITSADPATITFRGNLVRHRNDNDYVGQFNGLLKGQVSFCYDWDGRNATKWSSQRVTVGTLRFSSEGNDTTGTLTCSNGTMVVLATATFPNLTGLRAMNTGVMQVKTAAIGTEGSGLAVTVADSGTMDISEGVTLEAKTAFVGKWLEPGTYGSAEAVAAAGEGKALQQLTGLGLLTVAEYGGPKGLMLILR